MIPRSSASPRVLAMLGVCLVALTTACAALHVPGAQDIGSQTRIDIFVALCVFAAVPYFLAVRRVGRAPPTHEALWIVLGCAFAMRGIALVEPPFLSSDLYRYIWDGRVQAAGINPYLYIPDAPQLAFLRDMAIYPHIGYRESAPTIYPPAAQALFFLVTRIAETPLAMKAAMLALELIGIAAMIHLLRRAGRPTASVLIYAWNPLLPWEYAGNGHVDAAVIGCLGLALLAVAYRRSALTGIALALATLCKFLPIALFPAFWRRSDWKLPAASVAVAIALYLCYAGAGRHILGFLPAYTQVEGLRNGTGIYFVDLLSNVEPLPSWAGTAWLALAVAIITALALSFAFGSPLPTEPGLRSLVVGRAALVLTLAVTIATTPHYPWYFGWLAYLACLAPMPSAIYLSIAPVLLYFGPARINAVPHALIWLPFVVLAVRDILAARLRPALQGDTADRREDARARLDGST